VRATQLSVTERTLLEDWAIHVAAMFHGEVPFLVGSALERPNYRDVDVRLILDDAKYARLRRLVDIDRLGFVVSLWGQRVTGLPIDFQVQKMKVANTLYKGRRHALGIA
jgi:hypothetical protein